MDFDSRKKAFEDKFAHDNEIGFKTHVLAIREVSKWMLEHIPHKMESSRHYADTLINGPLVEKGFPAVIEQMKKDISEAEDEIDPVLIIVKLENAIAEITKKAG